MSQTTVTLPSRTRTVYTSARTRNVTRGGRPQVPGGNDFCWTARVNCINGWRLHGEVGDVQEGAGSSKEIRRRERPASLRQHEGEQGWSCMSSPGQTNQSDSAAEVGHQLPILYRTHAQTLRRIWGKGQ